MMNMMPLVRFLEDTAGVHWTVLYAGPPSPHMLPGLQRHIVFRAEGHQFIAEHDWVNEPLEDSDLRQLLNELRSG